MEIASNGLHHDFDNYSGPTLRKTVLSCMASTSRQVTYGGNEKSCMTISTALFRNDGPTKLTQATFKEFH